MTAATPTPTPTRSTSTAAVVWCNARCQPQQPQGYLLALKNGDDDDMYALIRGVLFISLAASPGLITGRSFFFSILSLVYISSILSPPCISAIPHLHSLPRFWLILFQSEDIGSHA